jgi:hypothetical protein
MFDNDVTIFATVTAIVATSMSVWQALMLRRQLRNEDKVRVASFYQGLTGQFLKLDLLFLERPHLRPYFFANQEPTDPTVILEVESVAEYLADMAETVTAAEDVLPALKGDWDDYLNHIYRNSPALRRYWASFRHLYPDRVNRAFVGPSARPKRWPEGQGPSAAPTPPAQAGPPVQEESPR